ncbi:hypothetical protein [Egibacter rhizosphaerae]|nr:hypothetical protein [Egibacter rhizosphaerae]
MADDADDGPPRPAPAGRRDTPPAWLVAWERLRGRAMALGAVLAAAAILPTLLAPSPELLPVALTVGWAGLLLMIAALWQPRRLQHHEAWVRDVRPPMDDANSFPRHAIACCTCGWYGIERGEVAEAFSDAAAHAPVVDPQVDRPMG